MEATIYRKNMLLVLLGRIVSDLGSALFRFGLSLYILDLTGSPAAFSSFLIMSILPTVIVNVFAGAIVDRGNKKWILILADLISGVAVLAFMLVFNQNPANTTLFLVYAVVLAVVQAFFQLSMNASIPELVPPQEVTRANSSFQAVGAMINVLGPVLGAMAYKGLGLSSLFFLDGVSFIVAGLLEILLKYRRERVVRPDAALQESSDEKVPGKEKGQLSVLLSDVREVFHYLGQSKGMIGLLVLSFSLNFFFVPMLSLVQPYVCYTVIRMSALQLSITQGAWAAGMIVGAIWVGKIKDNRPLLGRLYKNLFMEGALLLLWVIAGFSGMTAAGGWPVALYFTLNLFVCAFLNMMVNIPLVTFLQTEVPEAMRARLFGVVMTVGLMATPLGLVLFGWVLSSFYWMVAPIVASIAIMAASIISARNRHVHAMLSEYRERELVQCPSELS